MNPAWIGLAAAVGGIGLAAASSTSSSGSLATTAEESWNTRRINRISKDRNWYVSPARLRPGTAVPGYHDNNSLDEERFIESGDYIGIDPSMMSTLRGPEKTIAAAASVARNWRAEGRRSPLYLVLVENGDVTHCNQFKPSIAAASSTSSSGSLATEVDSDVLTDSWNTFLAEQKVADDRLKSVTAAARAECDRILSSAPKRANRIRSAAVDAYMATTHAADMKRYDDVTEALARHVRRMGWEE